MRAALLALLLVVPVACAQFMAMTQPRPLDRALVQVGAERSAIVGTLGTPTATRTDPGGAGITETYAYEDGGTRNSAIAKTARVVLYTAGDFFTVFLSQLLFIPAELLFEGIKYSAIVEYERRPSDGTWIAARIQETPIDAKGNATRPPGVGSAPGPRHAAIREQPVSSGTCFAISPQGLLLTAHHAVAGARSIEVHFDDGRRLAAQLQSDAEPLDLAVLRVDAATPTQLGLGSDAPLRIGQPVFTLGYEATDPVGERATLRVGSIVSLASAGGDPAFVQVGLPVREGHSGGPLLSLEGQVVGIVTSIQAGADPRRVSSAIEADRAAPLVAGQAPLPAARDRAEALARARGALCRVFAARADRQTPQREVAASPADP